MRDKITEAISKNLKISLSHYLRVMAILGLSAVLFACGDNPQTEINLAGGGGTTLNSPDSGPLTDDARAFKLNVWDPLKEADRCGTCHGTNGSAIKFVDQADFSAAYSNAITLVDLNNIANSKLVTQVGNGHNCWIQPVGDPASNTECAAIITSYINAWKNGTGDVSGRTIVLTPPAIRDPGSSKSFPVSAQDNGANSFANTVHPLLTQHCAACHSDTSSTPRAPFFASDDVNAAYDAAKSTMNLDTPASSRLVLRLGQESHNCWSNDCADDAAD
ncbi:MAG TPA: LamG domain-containing protein, partial [Gammaproteobacteria bacterium]